MKIDLYTACYNDAHMLDFFFRHYDPYVTRYIVFEDGSSDGSVGILRSHPKVDLRPPALDDDPDSFTLSEVALFDECWKQSRGSADWVILVDIDEHLYHPELLTYLEYCQSQRITMIPALGYQMLSDTFPAASQLLCSELTIGTPWVQMSKLAIFAPSAIEEVNFDLGKHSATPKGNTVSPDRDELLLLHYKYLGLDQTQRRHEEYATRLRRDDITKGWTARYYLSRDQLRADWDNFASQAVDLSQPGLVPSESHSAPRWWERYRRSSPRMDKGSIMQYASAGAVSPPGRSTPQ